MHIHLLVTYAKMPHGTHAVRSFTDDLLNGLTNGAALSVVLRDSFDMDFLAFGMNLANR